MDTPTRFPLRLIELRRSRGWTQGQLAGHAGASLRAVQYWEAGERVPSWPQVQALADALGVATDALRD